MKHKIYFHLGLNTKVRPKSLKDGECSIAEDLVLDEYGDILSRKFNTSHLTFTGNPIKTIFPYSNLFINANGSLYNGPKLIGSGYGSAPFNCVEYNNVLYVINRIKQLRWNGADILDMGNTKPTTKPYLVDSGAAGLLVGEYYYKITYEDKYGLESNPSPASNGVTLATEKMTVKVAPSGKDRITFINIYRVGGTLTDYYYVDRIYNSIAIANTALTYIDADDQGGLGYGIWGDGTFLYLANDSLGLETYTVDEDGVLTYVNVDDQGDNARSVWGDGNFVYLANSGGGIVSYAVDINGALTKIDKSDDGVFARWVWGDGKFVYLANDYSGLFVYLVSAAGVFELIDSNAEGAGAPAYYSVWGDGKHVYTACGDGVRSYNVDGNGKLTSVNRFATSGACVSVFGDGKFVYVAEASGLYALSVSADGVFTQVDFVANPGASTMKNVWCDGVFVYVSHNTDGLYIYTVDDSGTLTAIDNDDQGGRAQAVWGDNKFIYLANYDTGLLTYGNWYSYTDNVADSALSELMDVENNDPAPNSMGYMVEHYERMIGWQTVDYLNGVYFTREYLPESWGDNLNQQYLVGAGEGGTGLLSWGRYVVLFKEPQIYVMEGENPLLWHRRKSDSQKGNIAPYALQFWTQPIFCSYDGLYFFDGNKEIKFSDKIDSFFIDNKDYLKDAVGAIYRNKYYFGIKNKTLVYDLINKVFYIYNYGLGAIAYDVRDNTLYGGVSDSVVRLEQDMNNDDETVSFKVRSKAVALNEVPEKFGSLKNFYLDIDTKGEDVTFNIYLDDVLKQSRVLNTDSLTRVRKNFLATMKGQYAEFEFVYSGTKQIKISPPLVINPEEATNATLNALKSLVK